MAAFLQSVLVWHVSWRLFTFICSYTHADRHTHAQATLQFVCSWYLSSIGPCFIICLCLLCFLWSKVLCDKALCDKCFINKSDLIWLPSHIIWWEGLHQLTIGQGRRAGGERLWDSITKVDWNLIGTLMTAYKGNAETSGYFYYTTLMKMASCAHCVHLCVCLFVFLCTVDSNKKRFSQWPWALITIITTYIENRLKMWIKSNNFMR